MYEISELPPDKDFHIFVCYPGENVDEVRVIVNNLEKNGVKCCYHERDFTPGSRVLDNVHEAMTKSIHMLVILSEDFMNRRFCEHEVSQALYAKINEGYSIIPLKIEPCSVPDYLKHITYIDAENVETKNMHHLIIDAMLKQRSVSAPNIGKNGFSITFPVSKFSPGRLSLARYRLQLDLSDRQEIWGHQFQLSVEQLDLIEEVFNSSVLIKYLYVLKRMKRMLICIFLLILLTVCNLHGLVYPIFVRRSLQENIKAIDTIHQSLAFSIVLTPCILTLWLFADCCHICGHQGLSMGLRIRAFRRFYENLWKINKCSKSLKLIVFADFNKNNELVLRIMRYDFGPCETYFMRRLERKECLQIKRKEFETLKAYTNRLFGEFLISPKSRQLLTVKERQHERHRMVNGASCLCLCVEEDLDTLL